MKAGTYRLVKEQEIFWKEMLLEFGQFLHEDTERLKKIKLEDLDLHCVVLENGNKYFKLLLGDEVLVDKFSLDDLEEE